MKPLDSTEDDMRSKLEGTGGFCGMFVAGPLLRAHPSSLGHRLVFEGETRIESRIELLSYA